MDELQQELAAARQELAALKAEIETLKAQKSMVECVREAFSKEVLVKIIKRRVRRQGVEITISEADFLRLKAQAQSAAWVETKLSDLKRLGDSLWQRLNYNAILQEAIHRAEAAEMRCRSLEYQLAQAYAEQASYDLEDEGDREIQYQDYEGIER